MSVKTFCDGCNVELATSQIALIATSRKGIILGFSGGETTFHWCSDCARAIMEFTSTRRRNESGT